MCQDRDIQIGLVAPSEPGSNSHAGVTFASTLRCTVPQDSTCPDLNEQVRGVNVLLYKFLIRSSQILLARAIRDHLIISHAVADVDRGDIAP